MSSLCTRWNHQATIRQQPPNYKATSCQERVRAALPKVPIPRAASSHYLHKARCASWRGAIRDITRRGKPALEYDILALHPFEQRARLWSHPPDRTGPAWWVMYDPNPNFGVMDQQWPSVGDDDEKMIFPEEKLNIF